MSFGELCALIISRGETPPGIPPAEYNGSRFATYHRTGAKGNEYVCSNMGTQHDPKWRWVTL